jgi:hypothetical protein
LTRVVVDYIDADGVCVFEHVAALCRLDLKDL